MVQRHGKSQEFVFWALFPVYVFTGVMQNLTEIL